MKVLQWLQTITLVYIVCSKGIATAARRILSVSCGLLMQRLQYRGRAKAADWKYPGHADVAATKRPWGVEPSRRRQ